MATGFRPFYVQLFNTVTRQAIDDDSGVCNVLTDGAPGEVTIYSDDHGGATASNPISFTNGVIQFWTADTTTTVDLSILTSSSRTETGGRFPSSFPRENGGSLPGRRRGSGTRTAS